MKKFKNMTASKTATLDGPLFYQAHFKRNSRRNAILVVWYQVHNVTYLLSALILDALFLANSLYHNSLVEASIGALGLMLIIILIAVYDKQND